MSHVAKTLEGIAPLTAMPAGFGQIVPKDRQTLILETTDHLRWSKRSIIIGLETTQIHPNGIWQSNLIDFAENGKVWKDADWSQCEPG